MRVKVLSAIWSLLSALVIVVPVAETADTVESVDTFIGTQDEGNTFPGASMPFGMTHSSPIGSHYAGWRYDDPAIRGFGHFFLSGAGCYEQGGLVSILPTTGLPRSFDHRRYAVPYSHEDEVGKPGYYRVRLGSGVLVESTATTRTGVERFTFPAGTTAHVLVNVGQANDKEPVSGSSVRVVGDRTLTGTVTAQAFCGGRPYTTYFTTTFDRPFARTGNWGGESGGAGLRGQWVSFADGAPVTAYTALSHVDAEGADRNLAESRGMTFDAVRAAARAAWRRELDSISISTADATDRTVFYTALYHVLLQPLTGNDIDGRYRGFDNRIHHADGWTYYEYFSLWDTYRAQNQLLALLRPERARDIGRSLLAIEEQGGWLPRWAYANQETNTMTGDPVTPFLVDLWRFGALEGLEERAYAALWRNATSVPPASSPFEGRSGNPSYLSRGFVQYDKAFPKKGQDVDPHHGASATFEYALADCALSIMAAGLGHHEDAAVLRGRGRNYRVLWDPSVTDRGFTGFPRPRLADGRWLEPYTAQGPEGFHEGTAWQYQWLVQHDIPGLVDLLGGQDRALARLDDFFAYADLVADPARTVREKWVVGPYDYYDQFRYNPNNEPDLHAPWMYTLIGQPWKTSAVVRAAQTLFVAGPSGVTGNDDLGQMSAWYVFSALGLYPVEPGTGRYVLHAPRFEEIVVEGGPTITAPGADPRVLQYVEGVRDRVWVDHAELVAGVRLDFTLTDDPARARWGTSPESRPSAPCG
ncbi:GH92 family glycosyl hydrolase [Saccharothrix violaceirubra]|uniref:Putative alpha-1,2-mannosidase n=1 Tax=Saccharothrix violaceirubra TaxID=413306 RepID=A0A7W7T0A6_9PSEU|nr:GH92 family glycosyl hydrolase [Saccharothrix violaceirubra]MBB4963642.1 putative alpha-1,2-mannosidase [Saccharothrix violaceirubra]